MGLILGVDPGLMTGWSYIIDPGGEQVAAGQVHFDGIIDWLKVHPMVNTSMIVAEDFKLFQHKARQQSGSQFETVQVLGMLKLRAHDRGVPIVLQPPSIKSITQKFSGIKVPSNHSLSHKTDARLHAVYWLARQGRFDSPLEKELRNESDRRG